MSENNDKKDVIFSPAIPRPLVVDIAGRIKRLQDYLDPKNPMYQPEAQHDNIRTAIRLYEEGKLDGNGFITITDGKVGTLEAAFKSKTPSWGEVCFNLVLSSPRPHLITYALGDAPSIRAEVRIWTRPIRRYYAWGKELSYFFTASY